MPSYSRARREWIVVLLLTRLFRWAPPLMCSCRLIPSARLLIRSLRVTEEPPARAFRYSDERTRTPDMSGTRGLALALAPVPRGTMSSKSSCQVGDLAVRRYPRVGFLSATSSCPDCGGVEI